MKQCKGWWADGMALDICEGCLMLKDCKEDWIKNGGRMGGIFDKEMEKK